MRSILVNSLTLFIIHSARLVFKNFRIVIQKIKLKTMSNDKRRIFEKGTQQCSHKFVEYYFMHRKRYGNTHYREFLKIYTVLDAEGQT